MCANDTHFWQATFKISSALSALPPSVYMIPAHEAAKSRTLLLTNRTPSQSTADSTRILIGELISKSL